MSPRPQLPPEQVEAKKSAIIRATLDAIAAHGPKSVRLSDVATASGVSVGTVQYYFGSRDELLIEAFSIHSAAVLHSIEDIGKQRDAVRGGLARPWLKASLAAVPGVGIHGQRAQIWIELVTAARGDRGLQNCVDTVFDGWRELFAEIIDRGLNETAEFELEELSADEVVDTIVALIDGFDLAAVAGRGPKPEAKVRILTEAAAGLLEPRW